MVTNIRLKKFLAGLLFGIINSSMTLWIIVTNLDLRFIAGWIILNAIEIIAILSAFAIKRRLLLSSSQRKRPLYSSSQTFPDVSFKRETDFRRRYTTANGEEVKSKCEKLLADYFYQNDIRYQYERPAWTAITGDRREFKSKRMISRPDFYLLDYDVYVEYWGMVNTKDESSRADYIKSMNWKMAKYEENKIKSNLYLFIQKI